MKVLELTLPTPAENLACDEALLEAAEAGRGGEVLRFWESAEYFAVVGYANKVATEVNVPACEARRYPIHRRCSGGGTVVQGPGCLNYALVLRITAAGPTHSIGSANRFIMERNRAAVASCIAASEFKIEVQGHTDLAANGLKFSGNSQRRRKNFLLFHGTFLLDFKLSLLEELLPMPSQAPAYRAGRPHGLFVTNLGLSVAESKRALREAWDALETAADFPETETQRLVAEKYSTSEWNRKF